MDNKEKAKRLKAQGWLYKDIGAELGVSATMARKYVVGNKYQRPTADSRQNGPYACNKLRPGYTTRCVRNAGHRGVHLANEEDMLIYWE